MAAHVEPRATAADPSDAVEVDLPLRALGALGGYVVLIVLVVTAIGRAQQLLGLTVLAVVLALALTPLIRMIGRYTGDVLATVLVHLVVALLVVAGTAVVVHHIRVEAAALADFAQAQIDEATDGDRTDLLSRAGVSSRLSEAAASWGTVAVVGEDRAAGFASRMSQLAIVVVLSIFCTLQLDRLLDGAMNLTGDRDLRRRLREQWNLGVEAANGHLRLSAVIAVGSGAAAAGVAGALDVRGAVLLAFWAGLVSVVPLLGPAAGWAPLVVVVALNGSTAELIVASSIAAVVIGSIALMRRRARLGFRPGPFIVTTGIAAGLSAGGVAGAAAGLFLAVAGTRLAAADWRSILREHSTDGGAKPAEGTIDDLDVTPADLASTIATLRRPVRMRLTGSSLRRVSALIVAAFMLQLAITKIGPTLIWALVGVLLAIGLDRPVSWVVHRWGVHRPTVVVAGAMLVGLVLGVIMLTARSGISSSLHIDEDIPQLVETLESLPIVGDELAEQNLEDRIDVVRRRAPLLINRADVVDRAVALGGGGLVAMFWIAVSTLAALLDGPRLVRAVDRRVPARFTRQVTRLASVARRAIASYVGGSVLVASLNAVIITVMAVAFDMPMPAVLGLWAFSWNFVPQIGAIIGWMPVVLLALGTGPVVGSVTLAVFVVYQAIENNVIQPTVLGHAVDISALTALGAALFGAAVAGLVGAVLAIPIVGVANALRKECRRDDFPSIRTAARTA